MCRNCVAEAVPDRGSTALDDGSYLLNFVSCASCGLKQMPSVGGKTIEKSSDNEGPELCEVEETTYVHQCTNEDCGHVIAEHYHRYQLDNQTQEYFMECLLCGKGNDSQFVMNDEQMEQVLREKELAKSEVESAEFRFQQEKNAEKRKQTEKLFEALASSMPVMPIPTDNDATTDWD